jgi:hypothetical protein
MAYAKEKRYA